MDKVGTADIQGFKLPGSGTIKLSQIKSEFGGANNLKDYYGAASGVPNSGTIKLTDFYGKEQPPVGSPPEGVYDGYPFTTESWKPSPDQPTEFMDSVSGVGYGDPVDLPTTAGVVGANQYGDYGDVITWTAFIGAVIQEAVDIYNQYPRVAISIGGNTGYYSGSWSLMYFDSYPYAGHSSLDLGNDVRYALDNSLPFALSLQ